MFGTLRHIGLHQSVGKRLCRDRCAGLAVLTISLSAILATTGCGNQYRPVVSAISPVGPAGQPTKYAIAISSPSITSLGLVTDVDFSGDTVLATPQILINPNYLVLNGTTSTTTSSQAYVTNTEGSLDTFTFTNPVALITSTVTETTLPTDATPVSLSELSPGSGLATLFVPETSASSGPSVLALNATSIALYDSVPVAPNPVYVVGANGTPRVYAISQGSTPGGPGEVDSLETVSTTSLSNSAQFTVGFNPVYGVMTTDDRRAFILNEGSGTVSVFNVPNNAFDTLPPPPLTAPPATYTAPLGTIPLCNNPSTTIPNEPCPTTNPIWADLNLVSSELAVLNQGNSTNVTATNFQGTYSPTTTYALNNIVSYNNGLYIAINSGIPNDLPTDTANWTLLQPGTLSTINIPLCNADAQATNPNCSPTNPVDAAGFGQVLATTTVGYGPTMVSVLQGTDGNAPAAYVINQFDSTGTCGLGNGSVTVVDLATGQVSATICGVSGTAATSAANSTSNVIFGHPNSVSATGGEPTGKVYVTSADSQYLSVIYTDTNTVQTHIPLQGNGLRVLVNAQ